MTTQRSRLPVTPAILRILFEVWSHSSSQLDAKMLWAACCLGFFAFLRAGEFTYNPRPGEVAPAMLTAQDIAVDNRSVPSFLTIFLHRSKTDQFGRGITLVVG